MSNFLNIIIFIFFSSFFTNYLNFILFYLNIIFYKNWNVTCTKICNMKVSTMFIDANEKERRSRARTTLLLNNKCSGRRQRRRIIKREAWTTTTLKFKGGIHRSFQESFSAHNSTLLLDKISDGSPSAIASCVLWCHEIFFTAGLISWMIKIFRIIDFVFVL